MAGSAQFYITTPIYYPSNKLHIGNSYTTVVADAIARFYRLTGHDVRFLTGTDEHGQKIQRQAEISGETPQAFVDEIVAGIKELWQNLDISYDDFIRTTEPRHKEKVAAIFQRFYEQGDIYKGHYEGWYCTPCEAYWTERQLEENLCCPDCGRKVERVAEECYFFRMSSYATRLLEHIETHPEFILPVSRKNEMVNNFLKPGLEDLSVSRTSAAWGIPVPFDPGHVIYVWLDALSNYITALDYGAAQSSLMRYWPADVHLIGKDILRFHTIYWPIFLMALGLPLPRTVYGHGWVLLEEGKMSKSKGNVVDPQALIDRYGSDAVRYFLLREIPLGSDGVFSIEALVQRINADLANDLGNLVSRSLTMAERYFDGVLPEPGEPGPGDDELVALALQTPGQIEEAMAGLQVHQALFELWKLVRRSNKYIDENTPWDLAKDPLRAGRLATVIYHLIESIRFISVMVSPFIPRTPGRIYAQIGLSGRPEMQTWASLRHWGGIRPGTMVERGEDLFPRRNLSQELHWSRGTVIPEKTAPANDPDEPVEEERAGLITLDQFRRVDLRVGCITGAKAVAGTKRLLQVEVDLGAAGRRTVVAGIAEHYAPEELAGRQVLFVANLKPVKLKGILSEGMLLAATGATGRLALATVDRTIDPGSRVS